MLVDTSPTQGCHPLHPCQRRAWRTTGSTPPTATESWPASSPHRVSWGVLMPLPPHTGGLPPPAPSHLSRASLSLQPAHHPKGGAWLHPATRRNMCTVLSGETPPFIHRRPHQCLPQSVTVSRSALCPASSRTETSLVSSLVDLLSIHPWTDVIIRVWEAQVGRGASQSALPWHSQTSPYMTDSRW